MMTVKELIEALSKFDPDLPVALADWNEQYASPTLEWRTVSVQTWPYQEWHEDTKKYTDEEHIAVVLGNEAA